MARKSIAPPKPKMARRGFKSIIGHEFVGDTYGAPSEDFLERVSAAATSQEEVLHIYNAEYDRTFLVLVTVTRQYVTARTEHFGIVLRRLIGESKRGQLKPVMPYDSRFAL